ncbi:hypothetical protein QJS64_07845 [Paraclostridium bifermentans]|uniref:Uncharacterized protein n=1 Tax=Paraclostridium bifermentans TaxID=1490 RepID=A0ABY8R7X4_PARBF|nr:hypothetical protein QJS64_07845 [Paraclostridium bifermentans]
MIKNDLEIKLSIKNDKLKDINQKMKSIIGKEIKSNTGGKYSIPKELFSDDKKVSDVIRYKIEVKNETKTISRILIEECIDSNVDLDKKYKGYKRIVIIVESPHKYEYSFDYKPIGPAQGKTGIMIEKNIDKILELFDITDGEYILIISNPIQFQASLGSFYAWGLHDSIRNNLWTKLYEIYKTDFELRLKIYKPDYILNATTDGRQKG